jgi:hypothetical protein
MPLKVSRRMPLNLENDTRHRIRPKRKKRNERRWREDPEEGLLPSEEFRDTLYVDGIGSGDIKAV